MHNTTGGTATRVGPRPGNISPHCTGAALYDLPDGHRMCRGNGPLRIPGVHADVLRAAACGCGCHRKAATR